MKTLLRKCARRPRSLTLTPLTPPTTSAPLLAASRVWSVKLCNCEATVRWTGPAINGFVGVWGATKGN